ncbi:MAG: IclR family transcriptional regulator [Beijerinckiaceae bacterium]|nr:IclR family transcriptional regulator [Beijerinckiaceae bacterium]
MRKRELDVTLDSGDERDPQFIAALARGLDVLRAFRPSDPSLGNQEIARRTGLPKPTVSRITYTLTKLGYLSYLPDIARYRLSIGVLALGYTCLGSMGIRDVARPMMQKLANETGIPVALGTRDRLTMVYIEVCVGDSPFNLALEPGSHIKLATSAMGRAYLAALPPDEYALIAEQLAKHEGKEWPRLQRGIEKAVLDYKLSGFVTSATEWKPEVNSVGAPIPLGHGRADYSLNCGGPVFLVPERRLYDDLGPKLAMLAREIGRTMERHS